VVKNQNLINFNGRRVGQKLFLGRKFLPLKPWVKGVWRILSNWKFGEAFLKAWFNWIIKGFLPN